MKEMIQTGLKGLQEIVVERRDLASAIGNIGAEVLSTHRVVLLMELASRKAIEDFLPPGKMTVGTRISIRHVAAAPLGTKVRVESVLIDISGRRHVFDVTAYDEVEKLAEGQNELLIISVDAFLQKVKAKIKPLVIF
jgi:fluoroacetyl-CoA thioesterase